MHAVILLEITTKDTHVGMGMYMGIGHQVLSDQLTQLRGSDYSHRIDLSPPGLKATGTPVPNYETPNYYQIHLIVAFRMVDQGRN